MSTALSTRRDAFRQNWRGLSIYERFEQIVAAALIVFIAVIVVVASLDLAKEVFLLAWRGAFEPLDHRTFLQIFGQILTVLIALEFKHSIVRVVAAGTKIIQVRTVLLIAVLALARKLIILDINEYSALTIFALAAVAVALGVTYWLISDR